MQLLTPLSVCTLFLLNSLGTVLVSLEARSTRRSVRWWVRRLSLWALPTTCAVAYLVVRLLINKSSVMHWDGPTGGGYDLWAKSLDLMDVLSVIGLGCWPVLLYLAAVRGDLGHGLVQVRTLVVPVVRRNGKLPLRQAA